MTATDTTTTTPPNQDDPNIMPATTHGRAALERVLLLLVLVLQASAAAAAAAATEAATAAATAATGSVVKEPEGAPLQVVSIYRWLDGVGERDVLQALEGFMNLTHTVKAAAGLTAGADLRLQLPAQHEEAAASFSATLAEPDHAALEAFYRAPQRLDNTDKNVRPIAAEHISMVFESDHVSLDPPRAGSVRHACVYTFHPDVYEWEQGRLERELEELLETAPGVAHYASGNELWAQEVNDGEGLRSKFIPYT